MSEGTSIKVENENAANGTVKTASNIAKAGVVGFGTMGQGIALVLARAGIEVTAVEVEQARLDAGLASLRAGLEDRVKRGRMSAEAMASELERIKGATSIQALSECDLVIEAALEDMDIKTRIFAKLDAVCPAHAILTTNTSSLDIDKIAATTSRPENIAGAHFFAPAQVMKLLEIVRGKVTSAETVATLLALSKRIGKVGVCVGNGPGFVANRMYHRYTWQAYFLLQEGAYPEVVDQAMQDFGFPLGCLAVGDISGQDVAWQVRQGQIASGFIDLSAPYPVIADRMCERGWFGRKTGRGWYLYEDGKRLANPEANALIEQTSHDLGIARRDISADEIRERCLYALVNEGARLLGMGMVESAEDIDTIWRYGYGFPETKTGPMHVASELGLDAVHETLKHLHNRHGWMFEPAPLIAEYVKNGKTSFFS
ncbi:3-hydroxyacyl-CoA dehydrogenase NAD-binding domain-containing protein [Thalassospiraceae bacterium LMO-JJ14]|nr:3-hydroxyacyl-CoA dehydrogenase NAD-binding domain-containing protein [Thalassospiraceae bacterium LMO-JJ14]